MISTQAQHPPASLYAGHRNMLLLVQLRWIAVGGQLATIAVVHWVMGIALPLLPLLGAVACLAVMNVATVPLLRRRRSVANLELTLALLFDVAALTWQLHFTGGLENPFVMLFLLHIVLGSILLRPRSSWAIVVAVAIATGLLAMGPVPLNLPQERAFGPLPLYLEGSLVCFALVAILLKLFVSRINRNLAERDAALAASRQRMIEEGHIVRIGLLASGAAHELGTPLSTLSVILGDWKREPAFANNSALAADLADMQTELERCKTIVSGILMSAGEARGLEPEFTTLREFMASIITEWRSRMGGQLVYQDAITDDLPILSDPALRQVLGNVIDNAIEVSPDWISVDVSQTAEMLVVDVVDKGPGFSAQMLEDFGQPYRSTKGRPGGGLGLFLTVNVLRKLGGRAFAFNQEKGGAVVRLELPLAVLVRADNAGVRS